MACCLKGGKAATKYSESSSAAPTTSIPAAEKQPKTADSVGNAVRKEVPQATAEAEMSTAEEHRAAEPVALPQLPTQRNNVSSRRSADAASQGRVEATSVTSEVGDSGVNSIKGILLLNLAEVCWMQGVDGRPRRLIMPRHVHAYVICTCAAESR